jgi:large subunit ribosomal protein L24
MKRKLRAGDEVVVITGNDRGKSGKVLGFQGVERIVVEGVNVRKKHLRKSQANPKGQIIDIERSIHVSNVKPYHNEKAVKLRVKENKAGDRELYYKADGKETVYRAVRKKKG